MRAPLQAVADTQLGLFTRRQCELAGYRAPSLRQHTQRHGPWVIVRNGVYAERDVWDARTAAERLLMLDRAADLSMLTDHVMSHDSAARALGIPMLRPRRDLVHITREGVGGSRTEHGVKHHLARCELGELISVGPMTVTGPARTALDLAREHSLAMGVGAVDHVLGQGTTRRELLRELEVMRSWPHVTRVRRAVELGDGRAETLAESLARLLLVDAGFEDIDVQWPIRVRGRRYWTDLRVGRHVVEVDGLAKYLPTSHGGLASRPTRDILREERHRQADICAEGLGMSRLGWDDLLGRGRERAIDRVRREYAATAVRLGRVLPAHLAEQAAHIRRTTPRSRPA